MIDKLVDTLLSHALPTCTSVVAGVNAPGQFQKKISLYTGHVVTEVRTIETTLLDDSLTVDDRGDVRKLNHYSDARCR